MTHCCRGLQESPCSCVLSSKVLRGKQATCIQSWKRSKPKRRDLFAKLDVPLETCAEMNPARPIWLPPYRNWCKEKAAGPLHIFAGNWKANPANSLAISLNHSSALAVKP